MEASWTCEAAAALEGDAFEALVRHHQQRIFRVIHALVWDSDAAATLTQECFLKAHRGRHRFRGEAAVGTWLVSIALNLARDHLKSRRVSFWRRLVHDAKAAAHAEPSRPDPAASPERALVAREAVGRVEAAVRELSPQQREVFVLRFVEEMSLDAIARVLGVTEGTVKVHLHRATTAVRRRVKEER